MMNKVKLYMEVPTAHLDEINPLIDGHFVIASELLKNPDYYYWYKCHHDEIPIMLDNGAYEEGKPVTKDQLLILADELQPEVVFAPDTLHECETSLMQTIEFLQLVKDVKYKGKVFVIPQGVNAREIQYALDYLEDHWGGYFSGVGLSFKNPREEIKTKPGRPIHYLGLRTLGEISTWPSNVVSMDTVKPFKAAYHMVEMNDCRNLGIWNANMILPQASRTGMYHNIALLHKHLTRR